MNFTKPNMVTIRYTNSQWLREDATEVPVGRVAVPKTGQKNALPRGDAAEVLVGRVPVPKTGQKPPLPRDNLYPMVPSVTRPRAATPSKLTLPPPSLIIKRIAVFSYCVLIFTPGGGES